MNDRRRRWLPAFTVGLVLAGTLFPLAPAALAATSVNPATGGSSISADTAASGGSGAYTTLTGPTIDVTHPGGIATGTITLTAPSGFTFDPASTPAIGSGGTGLVASCGAPANTLVSCTVTTASSIDGTVSFSGIHVRPTAQSPLASGNMTVGGTAGMSGTAATLTEVPGSASQLAFTTPPGGGPAWQPFATQPVVTVKDAGGNTVTSSNLTVTLAIATNPSGGTLTCTGGNSDTAVNGVTSFDGCEIDKAGTGYTLRATAPGLTAATSSAFNVTAPQLHLVFTTQPGGGTVNSAWATQPVVQVQDPGGNVDTTSTVSVTLQIATNPGGAALTCLAASKSAVNGVVAYSGCKLDKPANGYTLTATATGIVGTTSAAFNVTNGPAAKVTFTTQPGGGTSQATFSTQPVVTVQDAYGFTVITSSATITLSIATGTGTSGATLSCTGGLSKAAVNGVATFSGCMIDKSGTGYKLNAVTSGLAVVSSLAFNVNPSPPTQLVIQTQPSSSVGASTPFPVQPVVAIKDSFGNTVTSSSLAVTLVITNGTGTSGAALTCSGGPTRTAINGVAAFVGCAIDKVGAGYTLTATATGVGSATTNPITVTAAAASKLVFTTQPSTSPYSSPFVAQPVVSIQDAYGNTVTTSSATVSLAIATGTGASGATLSCTGGQTKTASAGVATFSGCMINKIGTSYKLFVTATGLTSGTSAAFDITAGVASKLAFGTQPGGAPVGQSLNPQPIVKIQDAAGNTVASSSLAVTISITPGTGAAGATLTCTSGTTVAASSGLAAFSGCSIDTVGSGYSLTATAGGVSGTTSTTFTVSAGSATKLGYSTQPGGAVVSSYLSAQPAVAIQDGNGNTVTSSTATVTLALGSNPTGGTLSCTNGLSKAAVNGVATFAGCKIDKVGTGYTITATSSGLLGTTSNPFNISAGAPSKLVFTTQPAASDYLSPFPTQPVVTVADSLGNAATSYAGSVVLSITPGTGPSGATLTCTGGLSKAVVNGVAAFSGCQMSKPGSGFTLTATATGVTNAVSVAFSVAPGAASKLGFTTQPVAGSAGTVFTTQPVIAIQDANGYTVTGSSAVVALVITPGTGTAGASLTCTGSTSTTAVAGVAKFTGCAIDKVGVGYTLTASSTGLINGVSASFSVNAGPPAKLAFTTQPAGAVAATAFTTQPVVSIEDAGGNVVSASTLSVTLAITTGTGTSGAVLTCSGGNVLAASGGAASFAGCKIDKVGSGYTIKATSGTLAAGYSAPFTVAAGPGAKLAVSTQPVGAAYNANFATQPIFVVQDSLGNTATSSSASVTLAITSGTGTAGASLTCGGAGAGGRTFAAVNGIVTSTGCQIDKPGTGYTLTATSPGLTQISTKSFSIAAGTPTNLAFSTQPVGGAYTVAFPTQPVVVIQDAGGYKVTTSTQAVTLSITPGTGNPSATLSCTGGLTKAAVAGVVTFAGCMLDKAGVGYTLTATAAGLTAATSNAINISSGPAAKLAFTTQPVGSQIATPFATEPVVTIEDSAGNTVVSSSASVNLAISTGTGTSGAALSCSSGTSVAAVAGVATFTGCTIDKAGSGYTLKASSGTFAAATSGAVTMAPGPPSKLGFKTQPAGASVVVPFTTQPVVTVQDDGGTTASSSSASVTLSITAGSGASGATLTCTGGLTKAAVNGVASFSGCQIDTVGTGYSITATASGLTAAISTAFAVVAGPPAQLEFTTEPGATAQYSTALVPQPIVTIEDIAGNPVLTSTAGVTLGISSGTGTTGAKLSCGTALTKNALTGVATFSGCKIDKAGSGYTLTATSGVLTSAVSTTITITPGQPSKIAFTTQPPTSSGASVAFTSQPVVTLQDSAGNTASASTASVTIKLTASTTTTTTPPTLKCTSGLTVAAVAGVASFSGCSVDKVGTGYTLTASLTGAPDVKSTTFAIVAGPPAKVAFTVQTDGGAGGTAWSKQPTLAIQDVGGNTVLTSTASITLGITSGTGASGAALTCTGGLSKAATKGIVAFAGCTVDLAGTGYTLTATSTGLTSATSTAFNVNIGAPKLLGFTTQPVGGTGGLAFSVQPVVVIQDAGKTTITTSTVPVTIAITKGTGATGALLSCPGGVTKAAVAGVAAFSGCTVDRAGTGYTLTATSGSLTLAISKPFDMTTPIPPISIVPDMPVINQGGAAVLNIAFAFAGEGKTVKLEESKDGSTWSLVSPVEMDATGAAQFVYLMKTNSWFRVSFDGDSELLAGTTKPTRVLVRAGISISPTNRDAVKPIKRNTAITFRATVRPFGAGIPTTKVTFEVYKLVGAKWAFVARKVVATTALGRAAFKWKFSLGGQWSIRARAAGRATNVTSNWTHREKFQVQ